MIEGYEDFKIVVKRKLDKGSENKWVGPYHILADAAKKYICLLCSNPGCNNVIRTKKSLRCKKHCFSQNSQSTLREELVIDTDFSQNSLSTLSEESVIDTVMFECVICMDECKIDYMFIVSGCEDKYCWDCFTKYIKISISDNNYPIKCPNISCTNYISDQDCEIVLLPDEIKKLYQRSILCASDQNFFYCSTPNCDGLADMVPPNKRFVCPICMTSLCIKCKNQWHDGECVNSIQKDIIDYIKKSKAKICPKCGAIIEKTKGCNHMKCRCGNDFCYTCGKNMNMLTQYSSDHICQQ